MKNFNMDLQLFATSRFHPEDFEGVNPLLEEDAPQDAPIDPAQLDAQAGVTEVPLDGIPQDQPPQVGQPQAEQQPPELTEEPNPGEDIQAYLERMRQDILSRLPEQEQVQPDAGPTPEELAQENEQWLEQFYENPMQQVQQLAEQIANKKLEPIMAERDQYMKQQEVTNNIQQFRQEHPDMGEYTQDMVQIFNQMPELESHPKALEIAYRMAKGNKFDNVPKSIDGYLQDETAIDGLLQNEQIKNKLIQKLMNEKQTSPPVMGTGGKKAGNAALADPKQITSMRDATKAWMAQE